MNPETLKAIARMNQVVETLEASCEFHHRAAHDLRVQLGEARRDLAAMIGSTMAAAPARRTA